MNQVLTSSDLLFTITQYQNGYRQRSLPLVRVLRSLVLSATDRFVHVFGPVHTRFGAWWNHYGERGIKELCEAGFQTHLLLYALTYSNTRIIEYLKHQGLTTLEDLHWQVCARYARLGVFSFLFNHGYTGFDASTVRIAAARGDLSIVRLLHHHGVAIPTDIMKAACNAGHVVVAEYCLTHGLGSWDRSTAVIAVLNGRLNIVKFLHAHHYPGFAPETMDMAAMYGRLDIVTFLHQNRHEGCTERALINAASSGHLSVVQFLDKYRREGDVLAALEAAMMRGHMKIVKYFLTQRRVAMVRSRVLQLSHKCKRPAVLAMLDSYHRMEI
ncbi:hypothetical protein THRCLA_11716 [Thraustotheca clavata]|uniref:Ankyrin repeat-containing domain n=1 Tax=Thraustotheca clavata TaxID=74557 RepID=A0A1V9Y6U8_9STRA|nr:hypothetical protein THRCLA_11716 [Thraustotheca clavata]